MTKFLPKNVHPIQALWVFAAVCNPLFGSGALADEGVQLQVEIRGITSTTGKLQIGLYSTEHGFPEQGSERMGATVTPVVGSTSVVFKDVPRGTVALAVYHDENQNGALDKNFLGIPKEDYAFSNNARATLGPPTYKEAAVVLTKNTTIIIDLKK